MKKVTRIEPSTDLQSRKKKVAAYARVSMETERLHHSLSAQISYYNQKIQQNPDWLFAGVYADDGISGTATEKRDAFNQMMADCDAGKIDLVLTKSISRFARNTVDLPERKTKMNKKTMITFALAAVLLLSLGIAAYAGINLISTPEAAENVAREELAVWRELGILQPDVMPEGDAVQIYETEARDGGSRWYGRLFPHSYSVRWFGKDQKFGFVLDVDTLTGKIMSAYLDAKPDEDEPVVGETSWEVSPDPDYPEKTETITMYYYDNFDDLFPADLTVDQFCTLLAEYWGFDGYTLGDTFDEDYQTLMKAVDSQTLVKDLNANTSENYYLSIFFEGDQEGGTHVSAACAIPGLCGGQSREQARCWVSGTVRNSRKASFKAHDTKSRISC